jgi:hypothetical protein
VSVPEYDGAGVLVRTVHYREPEWDGEQWALMLAYDRYMADIGPHGHPMSEATNPAADPNNYEGGYRYFVDPPVIDWVEKSRLDAAEAHRAQLGDNANMHGLIFPVRRVESTLPE